jgi:integrase/recombinase XerD
MNFEPALNLTIVEPIDHYLAEKSQLGKLSAASVGNRRSELTRFAKFCRRHKIDKPCDIHKNLLKAYLKSRKVSNGTRNTLINIYRSFFDYLVTEELMLDNVATTLERPRTQTPKFDFLSIDELEKVFRWEAENASEKFVDRNLLIYSIMIEVGLRVSAIINLKLDDLRLDAKQIWIKQKGGSEKQVPITEDIVNQFQTWLGVRDGFKNAEVSDHVFLASTGRQLSRKQVYELVSRAIRGAGLVKRRNGPHLLRHTGATLRALRGDGIEKIRLWLDHTGYGMSRRYVHAAEQLRQDTVQDEILKDKGRFKRKGV